MALTVEIHGIENGEDGLLGTITWSGKEFSIDPEVPVLRDVLKLPLALPGGDELFSSEDPERFMKELHRHYRGTGLRASKAKE